MDVKYTPRNAEEAAPLLGNLLGKVERMRDDNLAYLEAEKKQENLLAAGEPRQDGVLTVERGLTVLSAMQRAWSEPRINLEEQSPYDIRVADDDETVAMFAIMVEDEGRKVAVATGSGAAAANRTGDAGGGMKKSSSMDILLSGFHDEAKAQGAGMQELKSHFAGLQNVFEQIEDLDPYGEKEVADIGFVEGERVDGALEGDGAPAVTTHLKPAEEQLEDEVPVKDDKLTAQVEELRKVSVLVYT